VQRYIESARGAVFFLDPHVCLKCHYRSTELLWQCPHCHEWNSFVEERMAAARQASVEM
jgi:lipopolysaccharide assembly protein B